MPDKSKETLREAALFYHEYPKPGKLEVRATKPLANGRDLSRAYSPGVAEACVEILEPVPTAGLGLADVPRLREQVRDRIAVAVERLREDLGHPVPVAHSAPVSSTDAFVPAEAALRQLARSVAQEEAEPAGP